MEGIKLEMSKISKINILSKQFSYLQPWIIWFIAGLFYMYEFVHRVSPNVMVPELMREFSVSGQALGNLSAYYYYAYAIAQIPVGILLDRYSSRYLLMLAAFIIAAGSFIFAGTENIQVANFARALIGIGSAFSFVACIRLAANWFLKENLGLIIGLTNLLGVAGAIFAGKPLAIFVENNSWRDCISYLGFIGAAFIFVIWITIRDKQKQRPAIRISTNEESFSIKTQLSALVRIKQIWIIAIFGSLMVAPIASYAELWGVSFLVQKYSLAKPIAAEIVAFTFVGIAFGGPINGWISDIIGKRKIVMLIGALGALSSLTATIFLDSISKLDLVLLHICFGFFTSSMLLCFSLNSKLVSINVRGTVIGFTNTIIMGVSVLFQPLIGFLLDKLNGNLPNVYLASTYKQALSPLLMCLVIACLLLFFIKEKNVN